MVSGFSFFSFLFGQTYLTKHCQLHDAHLNGTTLSLTSNLVHQEEPSSVTEESCEQSDKPRAGST
jgi:hypothetical protein